MVRRNHVFNNMKRKVKAYVRTCDICQRGKADTNLPRGKMGHLETLVRKWESVSVDFISLPETTSRSSDVLVDEILTVTDRATKLVVLIPWSIDGMRPMWPTISGVRWYAIKGYQGVFLATEDRCSYRSSGRS